MNKADVFFTKLNGDSTQKERIKALDRILKHFEIKNLFNNEDKVAVKIHVGENKNNTYISPQLIKPVITKLKEINLLPFLTETSTLYKGNRSNAIDHLIQAFDHGFTYEATGAPFIMADGLAGNTEIEVPINGIIFDKVNIAREIIFADGLIAVSHPTGHIAAGLGACMKNLGMGLASRMGKLRQHSSVNPVINANGCTLCGKCLKWCPETAITEVDGKAFINQDKCIGCGECLPVCNFNAVSYNWGAESKELQKKVAEHALGAIQGKEKKSFFINILTDMTKDCDCFDIKQNKVIPDIGILASTDPIAVDQATLDITEKEAGNNLSAKSYPDLDPSIQLKHGEKIGLGNRSYSLITI